MFIQIRLMYTEAMMPINTAHMHPRRTKQGHFTLTLDSLSLIPVNQMHSLDIALIIERVRVPPQFHLNSCVLRVLHFSFNTHTHLCEHAKQIKICSVQNGEKKHENFTKTMITDRNQRTTKFCQRQNNNNCTCVSVLVGWLMVLFSYREPIHD